jgi:hypothetical protein
VTRARLTARSSWNCAPLDRLSRLRLDRPAVMALQLALASVSLLYSSVLLAANSFNPFIYFRF